MYEDYDERRTRGGGMLHLTEDLVMKFSGQDSTHPISKWIQDIEDNAEIFDWTETQKLLVARRSLSGTAALWQRSEKIYKTWEDLKSAIIKEFPDTVDIKTIHELMSNRTKMPNESCIEYMLVMKELGKRGKMPAYVAIKYIVDGIQDREINKVMLYGVTTYIELKEKIKIYETVKQKMGASDARYARNRSYSNKPDPNSVSQQRERIPTASASYNTKFRYYNCGDENHASENCPNRQDGRKCFNCNQFGHISMQCTAKTRTRPTFTKEKPTKQSFFTTSSEGASVAERDNFMTVRKVGSIDDSAPNALIGCDGNMAQATLITLSRPNALM